MLRKLIKAMLIVLAIPLFFIILFSLEPDPTTEEILERHLSSLKREKVLLAKSKFMNAREWGAWVYLECSSGDFRELMDREGFTIRRKNKEWSLKTVWFDDVPVPPKLSEAVIYSKQVSEKATNYTIVLNSDYKKLWLRIQRY